MDDIRYEQKASHYLNYLCGVKPNRRTGSPGNQDATNFVADLVRDLGYHVDISAFPCLDYITGESSLISADKSFDIFTSPYSLGCDITAKLITVTSVEELQSCHCEGEILLMTGAICAEQLMPKNFVFYNPDHNKKIYALLEKKKPAGIVTATEQNPQLVGALYPFPLIVDGDFNIPNVYSKDIVGEKIAEIREKHLHLKLNQNEFLLLQSSSLPVRISIPRKRLSSPRISMRMKTVQVRPITLQV